MGLKFDIQVNIPDNIITEPATKAEHIVAVQAMKDTNPYVPFLTGSLSNRTRVDGGTIIYPGPYARYLYFGKVMVGGEYGGNKIVTDKNLVFTTSFHPMAQAHWFEASKAANIDKWVQIAGKAMKRDLK